VAIKMLNSTKAQTKAEVQPVAAQKIQSQTATVK
jgi:hypothetical protein